MKESWRWMGLALVASRRSTIFAAAPAALFASPRPPRSGAATRLDRPLRSRKQRSSVEGGVGGAPLARLRLDPTSAVRGAGRVWSHRRSGVAWVRRASGRLWGALRPCASAPVRVERCGPREAAGCMRSVFGVKFAVCLVLNLRFVWC